MADKPEKAKIYLHAARHLGAIEMRYPKRRLVPMNTGD